MRRNVSNPLPWFLLGAAAFLYLKLFLLPSTPVLIGGDQSFFVSNATRMLRGELIYRDFFQFTPPGTDLVYLSLFKAFGARAWVPNLVVILLGVGLTWVTTAISKSVLQGPSAFLPGLLFLTLVYNGMPVGTHHWFSTLAVMAGVIPVMAHRTHFRLAAAGALFGLASFFTQTRGAMALLALLVFLAWEHSEEKQGSISLPKGALSLSVSYALTIAALSSYYVLKVGLNRLVYCQVVYVIKQLPGYAGYFEGLPAVPPWHNLLKSGVFVAVHAFLPLAYVLFLFRYRRGHGKVAEPWDRLVLVSLVGFFLFLEVAPGPSCLRLYGVFAPALIILIWLKSGPSKLSQACRGWLWATGLAVVVAGSWSAQRRWRAYLDLPSGRTAIPTPAAYERLHWLLYHTRPSDYAFEADGPDIYFPLDLRNPTYVYDLYRMTLDSAPSKEAQVVLEPLKRHHVRYILWTASLDTQDLLNGQSDHLAPMRASLSAHYHVVKTFADGDQVWERKE